VSTLALAIPALVGGRCSRQGIRYRSDHARCRLSATYVKRASGEGFVAHLLAIIPDTFMGAFAGATCCRSCWCRCRLCHRALGELGERINAVIRRWRRSSA
jgi:hypothetical protein